MNDFKEKLYNFIKPRAIFLFIIFFAINVIASLPFINHITEILSHFKLHYFYCSIVFFIIFIYLSFFRVTVEHILTSKDIRVKSYNNGNNIDSDHFPVFTELTYSSTK